MSAAYPKYAIIVAGGSGSRMQAAVPKQFLPVAGQPVLMHTIRRFAEYNAAIDLIVVLPAQEIKTWQQLCAQHEFTVPHTLVAGGDTRFQSVQNGLAALYYAEEGVVAVHDGVRPFIDATILAAAYDMAHAQGTAVVAVPLKDSLRKISGGKGNKSKAVDRSLFRLVQTPQCFKLPLLRKAYEQPESPLFTDDASVVEQFGHRIHLVEGSYRNIKLTTPEDLELAEAFLRTKE